MINKQDTFQELVSWATWFIIEGITKGDPLRGLVFHVLEVARQWEPKKV